MAFVCEIRKERKPMDIVINLTMKVKAKEGEVCQADAIVAAYQTVHNALHAHGNDHDFVDGIDVSLSEMKAVM